MIYTATAILFLSFLVQIYFAFSDISYRIWLDRWSVVQKVLCFIAGVAIPISLNFDLVSSVYCAIGFCAIASVNYTVVAFFMAVIFTIILAVF